MFIHSIVAMNFEKITVSLGGQNPPVLPPKSIGSDSGTWTVASAFAKWDSPRPLPRPDVWENPGVKG